MRSLLGVAGVEAPSGLAWDDPRVEAAGAAVVVGSYAIEPARYARWLRRDVPHLAVVFGDAGVTVGPLVEPGAGPCLRCLDLHRTDADPAWPVMAAQLFSLRRPGETELVVGAVASVAVAAVLRRLREAAEAGNPALAGGGAWTREVARFDPGSGGWTREERRPHPECGCHGLPAGGGDAGGGGDAAGGSAVPGGDGEQRERVRRSERGGRSP
jgi:bacteriocin biosynthesis cyclodehydratase domain-containing protein